MYQTRIHPKTPGEGNMGDLTPRVEEAVRESGVREGLVNVFVSGSTAAVTTIGCEDGVLRDLVRALQAIKRMDSHYHRDALKKDGTGIRERCG
jgi:thiamine phosphate synthase YjbQ (UPF0047 family)